MKKNFDVKAYLDPMSLLIITRMMGEIMIRLMLLEAKSVNKSS